MFVGVLQWDAEALRQGRSWHELWQLPCLYPQHNMLACSEHMLGSAALFAPFYFLTGRPVLAFNLWLLAVAALNFASAYLVARRLLKSPLPALLVAVLFAFGFVRLHQQGHFHLWPHFPTPLLFLAVVRLAERPQWRWPLLAGLCLAGQLYLSMYLGYMAAVMLGIMLGTLVVAQPRRLGDWRFLTRLALACAVATLLVLPLAGPYREAARRWGCWTWEETRAWIPGWAELFTREDTEKSGGFGLAAWALFAAGAVLLAWRHVRGMGARSAWVVCAVVLPLAIACAAVDQFHAYRLLYRLVPGFKALRCPGRMMLAALWPCGLVGGWTLAQFGTRLGCRAGAVVALAVVGVVFTENQRGLDFFDARLPEERFYRTVVRSLPEGAVADFPLTRPGEDRNWKMAERFAAQAMAGWRPTLNVFTSRMPGWYYTLNSRQLDTTAPESAAALMGELRLRGVRYVILHKDQTLPEQLRAWCEARSGDGRPCGRVAYDGPEATVLDLWDGRSEARLPAVWAACEGGAAVAPAAGGAVEIASTAEGVVTFTPTMPLRPGRYRVRFEVEGGAEAQVRCGVVAPSVQDTKTEEARLLEGSAGRAMDVLFAVPRRIGPEQGPEFRVAKKGPGRVVIHGVTITPVD
jgi:hypothetical protein